jgi:CheY-like chemotaxis protein
LVVVVVVVVVAVMDGLTATLKIRELEMNQVPIIGLTAGATQEDKEKCLTAGMDDYLSKPVSRARLLQALRRWTVGRDASMRANPETSDRSIRHSHN